MSPDLSIVIPSHQRADLLRVCLTSVTRHAPSGTEILVVDDASTGEAIGRTAQSFHGVRLLRLPRRAGFCRAANLGIGEAGRGIVELLNDDTEVTPGWAEAALRHFADPAVGAVAPLVLRQRQDDEAEDQIDSAGDRYYLGGIAGKRGHGERLTPAFLRPCCVFGASASSAFYRREAVLRAGGFPESFGAYFEDVDLAFRLRRHGYVAQFEPGARVYHRMSASYGPPRGRLLQQQSRNEERVFWRNLPGRALVRALPLHLAVLGAKACRHWQQGSLAPFLSGRLRILGEVRALLAHRRTLQRTAPATDLQGWQVETHFWR